MQYGDEDKEDDPSHLAFLLIHPETEGGSRFRIPCIGASCFRFHERTDHPVDYSLQWVWFHPYWRRRGLLSNSWPGFKWNLATLFLGSRYQKRCPGFWKSIKGLNE